MTPPDSFRFHYYNANPRDVKTCDCVVRALSVAMEKPYEFIMKELLDLALETGFFLNDPPNYAEYLKRCGWTKHPQPTYLDFLGRKRKYTGTEFCGKIACGTPVLAHIGSHHIVAIRPYNDMMKIWDTWDSSPNRIGYYWTKDAC